MKTYYTFNGKAVALRDSTDTTNYPAYIHGDHLGSVSVVTNSTGGTVSQEFDPWGKVRSGGTSATKRNFTGQYLDDTGLLFYNARYYDPAIGRFLSADTIAPGLTNPQNRNRYTYTVNNPLNYVDPSGNCAEGYDETLEGCKQYLTDHGWNLIEDDYMKWLYEELDIIAEAIFDLKGAVGWDTADYKSVMTGSGKYTLQMKRSALYASDLNRPAEVYRSNDGVITMHVYDMMFYTRADEYTPRERTLIKATVVHEMAHVWDAASNNVLSQGLMKATGGGYPWWGLFGYQAGGKTASEYGRTSPQEDWAETVAASVYPEVKQYNTGGVPRMDDARKNFIRPFLPNAKLFK